jgi:hypothetical protein
MTGYEPECVEVVDAVTRRLGDWTTAGEFDVQVRTGCAVLDLRGPRIPDGDLAVRLDVRHGVVTLLVPTDAVVDDRHLSWSGRGRMKQMFHRSSDPRRRILLSGQVRHGEVRIKSAGMAQLAVILTREFFDDARRAHRAGGVTMMRDPTGQ